MTPREFLELLWRYKPEDQYVLLWTLPDHRSHWFLNIDAAAEFTFAATEMDVYVGVGCSKRDFGPVKRCKSEEVSGICGIGTDLDLKSQAHGNKPLPTTIAEALSILPVDMPPTVIILTGNGAHAWWLFKEPYIFESEEDRADVARVLNRWHTMLRLNSAAHGWVYDRLSDLARILRIPGTRNLKDPKSPKDVTLHTATERFYELFDVREYLDDSAVPDPAEEERAAREWKERFADKPLKIDLNARITQELLDSWMDLKKSGDAQRSLTFRNTWERRRDNLKDPSQSGYDLALADFGVDAGLSEQQVVDLIVHHRFLHSQKQRTGLEYFQRTIAKAQKRSEWCAETPVAGATAMALPAPPAAAPVPPPAGPASKAATTATVPPQPPQVAPARPESANHAGQNGAGPQPPPGPEVVARNKALMCARISTILTVPVVRLVKITGKDPQYRMELSDGQKLEFPTVRKLLTFDAVYDAIAAATNRCIPKVKPKMWEQVKQMILDALFEEEGSEEMQWEGAARMYLERYLSQTGFIATVAGQRAQELRNPMVVDGAITVCADEVLSYMTKSTFQKLTIHTVVGGLSALGASSLRVRGPKHRDQSRWVLPADFDPHEYPQYIEQ